jgi:hypothetical protein
LPSEDENKHDDGGTRISHEDTSRRRIVKA